MIKAMFVNECGGVHYAQAIAQGYKPYETRSRDMLRHLVGERVAIVRTRRGIAPTVVGYVTVTEAIHASPEWLDAHRGKTLVPEGSKFDHGGRSKWVYVCTDAEVCDPFLLPSSAVRHGRSWCEF